MLSFCPNCSNILIIEEGQTCYRLACNTCPFILNIDRKMANRKYCKLKEIDDVLGGAAAWENVDSTGGLFSHLSTFNSSLGVHSSFALHFLAVMCETCGHDRAYFMQIQTRSADEPMTTFYKCCNAQCGHRWRE